MIKTNLFILFYFPYSASLKELLIDNFEIIFFVHIHVSILSFVKKKKLKTEGSFLLQRNKFILVFIVISIGKKYFNILL